MAAANAPSMLHRALLVGQLATAVVFLFTHFRGIVPLEGAESSSLVAYTLAGIGALQVATAFVMLRPRVPVRSPGQTVEQFWATPSSTQAVFLVWFVLEAAAVLSGVGFFLTGDPVPALVAAVAILAFAWTGPSSFEER